MQSPDGCEQDNQAPHDRISRPSAATLRISDSLDLDTVLHEVVKGARTLTCARCGVIATLDDAGQTPWTSSAPASPPTRSGSSKPDLTSRGCSSISVICPLSFASWDSPQTE